MFYVRKLAALVGILPAVVGQNIFHGNGVPSAYIENTPAVVGQSLSFAFGSPTAPSGLALLKFSGGLGPSNHPVVGPFGLADPDPFYAAVLFFLDPNGDAGVTIPLPPGIGSPTAPPFYSNCLTVEPGLQFSFSKTVRVEWANPDSWKSVPVMFGVRQMHTATALGGPRDNRSEVLLCGGATGSLILPAPMATAQLFVPLTRTVRSVPNMALPRSEHRAVLLQDGRILITGGVTTGAVVTSSCEFFDPVTETFSPAPSMNVQRSGHAITLLQGGRVLVSGGVSDWQNTSAGPAFAAALNTANATAEVFDPVTNTWSSTIGMAARRLGHSQTLLLDGRVLVVCGIRGGAPSGNGATYVPTYTETCEIFDPATNSFTATAPRHVHPSGYWAPTGYHGASLLPNGDVLVTGGFRVNPLGVDPSAVPSRGAAVWNGTTWVGVGLLPTAVAFHRQVAMGGGALLTGGYVGDLSSLQTISSVGMHDGSVYTSLQLLVGSRAAHSCTQLHDGTFLVYGGSRWPASLADGAIYTPN